MLIFRPNRDAILPEFLFEVFRSDIFIDQVRKNTSGAAQPQLPIKTLVDFHLPVPESLADQRSIVSRARELEREASRLERIYETKSLALEDLKQSLLHQAFTGKL